MGRIKYIKAEKFFAKEYKDGIIVAFKYIGDNNSSYADQIHQMVSKNYGVDLFAPDIIESISGVNSHKDGIKESLFIYVKNGVSISACGIRLCPPNKDYIEVHYNSEKVLTIQKKRSNQKKRSKRLWCVCILVILCICVYKFYDDIIPDGTEVKIKKEVVSKETAPDETEVKIQEEVVSEETAPIETIIFNNQKKNESEQDSDAVENIAEVETTTNVKCDKLEYYHAVDAKVQHEREDAGRDRQRKLIAEANEYVRIADQAYNDYADSFNESKGIAALKYYKKALDLDKKHGLFFVSEIERIEQKVNILKKELK